jgi:hypothetical protein
VKLAVYVALVCCIGFLGLPRLAVAGGYDEDREAAFARRDGLRDCAMHNAPALTLSSDRFRYHRQDITFVATHVETAQPAGTALNVYTAQWDLLGPYSAVKDWIRDLQASDACGAVVALTLRPAPKTGGGPALVSATLRWRAWRRANLDPGPSVAGSRPATAARVQP